MTYDEYVEEQSRLLLTALALAAMTLAIYQALALTRDQWLAALASAYAIVEEFREYSAALAREFFDAERERRTGLPERHQVFLAEYDPDWFEEAMQPAYREFSRENASDSALALVLGIAGKEIENAGRRTLLRAVDSDPMVRGWARVEGGNESCAFCEMLISRGPVYKDASSAGLSTDNVSAVEILRRAGQDDELLDQLMNRWHDNCDCKVVPVFRGSEMNWPGRERYLAAERLWIRATKGYSGKDALNAFRRAFESGDREPISPAAEIAAA